MVLNDILQDVNEVQKSTFISESTIESWITKKSAKKIKKTNRNGFEYVYAEGNLSFPDNKFKPSRTIITSELQKTPSRTSHVIEQNNKLRKLTPIELERLNGFPENHTKSDQITDTKRGFLMGNALVVGVVEKIGKSLIEVYHNE